MYRIKILSLLFLTLLLVVLSMYQFIVPDRGNKCIYDVPGNNGELMTWAAPFSSGHPGVDEGSPEKVKLYLGTDYAGNDLAFRISKGVFSSMVLSFLAAVLIFVFLGSFLGIIIGFNRSKTTIKELLNHQEIFSRIVYHLFQGAVDYILRIINAIPMLLLVLISVIVVDKSLYDANPLLKLALCLFVYGLLSTPKLAFLIKDKIKSLEDEEFIDAARASGISDSKLVFTHIIRYECSSIIFLQAINIFIQAIMLETVIAFLEYGVRQQKYETVGKLIFEFRLSLPGTIMGDHLAILPIVMLLLIAFLGNSWSKELLDEQYE
jgi:ABC-type dipeptide/oligopeptide/nickel transport system permease subunit